MRGLLAVPLLLSLSACTVPGLGDDGADPEGAETALLAQRDDVVATATALVDAARAEAVAAVEVTEVQGGWDGCSSIFPEGYADFQYTARVQLSMPAEPERLTELLDRVADRAGLEVTATEHDRVVVTDGDVTAQLWDLPPANTTGDLTLLLAADPCVDVPRDDWPDWMSRDDPGPPVD